MNVGYLAPEFAVQFEIIPEYFQALVETLRIKRAKNYRLARAGRTNDGGYVLIDNLYQDGIAYSFGISTEISFDEDLADCDYQIFMYDMTIEDISHHRPEFHFYKEGIGRELDLSQRLNTLENLIERNGHSNRRNMILKMDVEGAEWGFLETVRSETLAQFDQMVFEFHGISLGMSYARAAMILERFLKINQTHQVVHIHGNNANNVIMLDGALYPNLLEITYANRANYEFEDAEIILPHPDIDSPNLTSRREVPLGNWNARFRRS